MKKICFLISTFLFFWVTNFMTDNLKNFTFYNKTDYETETFESDKYLKLSYENGEFYSWNQSDTFEQHVVGIFIDNNQSYLLDNYGTFWNLNYKILNFFRISDDLEIIQFEYLQDENKIEYFHHYFFVHLNKNELVITYKPIMSKNFNFVKLNQEYVLAYGIGLDLIKITDQSVNNLIPAYEKGLFETSFYVITENTGIFVAGDQYFYLLKDITGSLSQKQIFLKTSIKTKNNLLVVNENNLIIRDENNLLYLINLNQNILINKLNKVSNVKNFAFMLDHETFILNVSLNNSSFEYGKPYLVKITDFHELIPIPNINNLNNLLFINENQGVVLDKNLLASTFTYKNNDNSFFLTDLGKVDNFQFINKNLFFGSLKNHNFLLAQNSNRNWLAKNSIQFTSNYQNNFLNNITKNKTTEIDYQNTYFSKGISKISITNENLSEMVVTIKNEAKREIILKPKDNNITYEFLDFTTYQLELKFFDNSCILKYQVIIVDFIAQNLLDISGSDLVSYVGYNKNGLFDIKSVDQTNYFNVSYELQYLQYVRMFVYDDAKNMIVKNISFLETNSQIRFNNKNGNVLFGLQLVDVFNQINWIYLGFNTNGTRVMLDFWDTDAGKDLMSDAKKRKYLEKDLKNMNSHQIQELIKISYNWKITTNQAKIIIITVVSFFFLATLIALCAIFYNIFLNKRIAIVEVEHNKILKNDLDL